MAPHNQPRVTPFFDRDTSSFSYVVADPGSRACAIIDSVMEFDYPSGRTSIHGADLIIAHVEQQGLEVHWHIETHVHADHISAAPYLQERLGGKIGIGKHITQVQETFGRIFNEGESFPRDGSQFDHLFEDGEKYRLGNIECTALHTPGHTPACMTHLVGDAVFVGDTLFMPDGGTARADFPGGDARTLHNSIERILALPGDARVYVCHDYMPEGRQPMYLTSISDEREHNIHARVGISADDFVSMREARDKTLGMPRLILPSLQINMRAGHLPEAEGNGVVYLKIPLNLL